MNTFFSRKMRKAPTKAERVLWEFLRKRRIEGYKFRRQQPMGSYIVDFICFEKRLIIELDGGQHATNKQYDHDRTAWLSARGYRVLRFWNNEVLTNTNGVLTVIHRYLPPPAQPVRLWRSGRSTSPWDRGGQPH
jgi:very-short-patch-repair endonuclease